MSNGVGVSIHDEERILSAQQNKMGSIIAGARRLRQEIGRDSISRSIQSATAPTKFRARLWETPPANESKGLSAKVESICEAAAAPRIRSWRAHRLSFPL